MVIDNKSILITGGTGSLGSAIAKKILSSCKPKRLVLLSRNEYRQFQLQSELKGKNVEFILCDIRDIQALRESFKGIDLVIHTAALKRIEKSHDQATEFVKTNVVGSMNVVQAAIESSVKKVLAISTDKAVDPINPYGATKFLCESIFLEADRKSSSTKFSVIRMPNLSMSSGSIFEILKSKKSGEKITVTDKDASRYVIDIDRAAKLIFAALTDSNSGLFIPKCKAFKLGDLVELWCKDNPIKYIGLRPGERLEEFLFSASEAEYIKTKGEFYIVSSDKPKKPTPRLSSGDPAVLMNAQELKKFLQKDCKYEK